MERCGNISTTRERVLIFSSLNAPLLRDCQAPIFAHLPTDQAFPFSKLLPLIMVISMQPQLADGNLIDYLGADTSALDVKSG
jgi:hypothetical protein